MSASENASSLFCQPVLLRRASRFAGNGQFLQSVIQEALEIPPELAGPTDMSGGCHQHFSRNRGIEARLKHGDLPRRQYSLALLAPRLALSFALDCEEAIIEAETDAGYEIGQIVLAQLDRRSLCKHRTKVAPGAAVILGGPHTEKSVVDDCAEAS